MSPARFHRAVQLVFLLFMAWVGWRFFLYARWAMGQSEVFVARPPSVEGFLPISALLAARRLFAGGGWDAVHPAGLCILLVALASALVLRKGFCGFLCPVGAVSHLLFRLGGRLGLTVAVPARFAWMLAVPKYLLLAFFLKAVIFSMSLPQKDVGGVDGQGHDLFGLVALPLLGHDDELVGRSEGGQDQGQGQGGRDEGGKFRAHGFRRSTF